MEEIIGKINDLFITTRQKYLFMNQKGQYFTFDKSKNNNVVPLIDSFIKKHLEGEATYGVFGGEHISKFLCFDIDVPDRVTARWIAYRTINALVELGVSKEYIYPSTSGNKGYHIDLYFEKPVSNKLLHEFYILVMETAYFERTDERYAYRCERGMVEMRPVASRLGVKLPLGKHFNTKGKKRCWYVNVDTLEEIRSKNYILEIKKIKNQILEDILESQKDLMETSEGIREVGDLVDDNYQSLEVYSRNIDESLTIEHIEQLWSEGLKEVGTRHNALLKLAKYLRYQGLNQEECQQALQEWMFEQDTRYYRTLIPDCIDDITKIVEYVYKNEVALTITEKDIDVTHKEMERILDFKKRNQKLLMYAMLVHSKRYALQNGVFYMTQKQMAEATGYDIRTIQRILPELEEQGAFEYISKNVMIKNRKGQFEKKKPNRYKLKFAVEEINVKAYSVKCNSHVDYKESFNECVINLFEWKELRAKLSKRHYDELRRCKVS
ncbi:phosphopantetheinyl transferase (holo-ACP synthase) [Priestia aryabhattai]|uniref:TOTE conflict system archaeo-eukaryotic primase domain-containing protein n=1 Tax=Priestia aryabhattai TaxID=412384 RepID=UPI0027E4FC1D|nr:primase C-terminal domain-containing protein [Priestia aryabhattai]MDP9727050.1 phosphopantetheinyl transferase (holo-ACP synthase) [Priestia aryabhattai]